MQYRIEVIKQGKDDERPKVVHRGDIVRSRDVATVIFDNATQTQRDLINYGVVIYAKVRMMERYTYFGKWVQLESLTMDQRDKE